MGAERAARLRQAFSSLPGLGLDLDHHTRRVANQERRLLTLLELGREAAETQDEPGLCSIGLLTLMGYMGTSHSAMWTCGDSPDEGPRLADAHGIQPELLEMLTHALPHCGRRVRERRGSTVVIGEEIAEALGDVAAVRMAAAGLAVVCTLLGSGEVVGYVVLGRPVGSGDQAAIERDVLDAACGLLGVSVVNVRLIARLRARSEELLRANEDLSQLDRLKSHFMSNINHELRTPIAIIQGAVTCLQLPDLAPDESRRFIEMIEINSSKLTGMIQTLLDFSVLSTSITQPTLEPTRLDEIADTFHRGRRDKVAQGGRQLECDLPVEPVVALAEEKRVFEILDRLVDNSMRFTPEGTRITLRVRADAEASPPRAVLVVEDDGPGIEPSKVERVFQVFEQGDGSSTRRVGGLGIGLAVARRQAEVMGGKLEFSSEPGKGARFVLRLPLA